jgi:hypothetical protein
MGGAREVGVDQGRKKVLGYGSIRTPYCKLHARFSGTCELGCSMWFLYLYCSPPVATASGDVLPLLLGLSSSHIMW